MKEFEVVPMSLREVNAFIEQHHRHHKPARGCKFCIGLTKDGKLVAVASVGRPVARGLDDGFTAEVNRACTDGTKNANSKLYGICWKVAQALGYKRLITYTLPSEGGASLRGAGWKVLGQVKGRTWSCPSRPRTDKHPLDDKLRWGTSAE